MPSGLNVADFALNLVNLLVRIHFIIVMIRWTGLTGGAPSAVGAERGGLRTEPGGLRSGGSPLHSRQDHRAVAPGVCRQVR